MKTGRLPGRWDHHRLWAFHWT